MAERMAGYNSVVGDILVDPFGTAIVAGPYVLEEKQLNKHAIVMIHGLADNGNQFDQMSKKIAEDSGYSIVNIIIKGSNISKKHLELLEKQQSNELIVVL
jgi:hypothetical protein